MSTTDTLTGRPAVLFTGPRWRDLPHEVGAIDLGPYDTGEGSALYTLFAGSRMASGHLSGPPGTGLSTCVNAIAVSARASGRVVIAYLDGTPEGDANPFLTHFADYPDHGADGARRVLAMARNWADERAQVNPEQNTTGFTSSPQRPALLILIEDADRVFADPDQAAGWLALLQTAPEVGIGVLTTSHTAGLAAFGGSEYLHTALTSWNNITFPEPATPGHALTRDPWTAGHDDPFWVAYTADWNRYLDTHTLPRVPLDEGALRAVDSADNNARYWSCRQGRHGSLRDVFIRAKNWVTDTIKWHARVAALVSLHVDDLPAAGEEINPHDNLRRAAHRTARPARAASWVAVAVFAATAPLTATAALAWQPERDIRDTARWLFGTDSWLPAWVHQLGATPLLPLVVWLVAYAAWVGVARRVANSARHGQYAVDGRVVLTGLSFGAAWVTYQQTQTLAGTAAAFVAVLAVLAGWRALGITTFREARYVRLLNQIYAYQTLARGRRS